ncbi:3-deoxy-manno-octulosonate cytidylyltransferase, partial [Alphaproteobacteria bacterium]|nr:3-deoxy-manno-octulosonate cytidylyltransferase [Alphaproteobacteria bacterium]
RESLSQFVKTPPSALEKTESLEQLRALELGLIIGAGQVNSAAAGIDTEQDLIYARSKYSKKADTQ